MALMECAQEALLAQQLTTTYRYLGSMHVDFFCAAQLSSCSVS